MSRFVDPKSRCTPVSEWPERDRAAWAIALLPADPFDPSVGYAARWKTNTTEMIQSGYGRWIGWHAFNGTLDPAVDPGDRATQDHVIAFRDMLSAAGQADYSIAGRLQQLANALKAMEPAGDWQWIQRASSRIHSRAIPVRDQVGRMQPVEEVIALGHDLMHAAEHDRFRTDCDRATLYRDGLILAFLMQRPFRRANLTSMTLGRHVQRRGDQWRLSFSAAETKGEGAIECAWPGPIEAALDRYIAQHREVLLLGSKGPKKPTQALWISRQGQAMGSDAIYYQVRHRTKDEFGTAINLHNARHIGATTIATANPSGATDIMHVLGHASMKPSEKHYNRATMLDAGSTYQATIAGLRGGRDEDPQVFDAHDQRAAGRSG